jgi:hypothetical protein
MYHLTPHKYCLPAQGKISFFRQCWMAVVDLICIAAGYITTPEESATREKLPNGKALEGSWCTNLARRPSHRFHTGMFCWPKRWSLLIINLAMQMRTMSCRRRYGITCTVFSHLNWSSSNGQSNKNLSIWISEIPVCTTLLGLGSALVISFPSFSLKTFYPVN